MTEGTLMGVCSWVSDYFGVGKEVGYDGTATAKVGVFTVKW